MSLTEQIHEIPPGGDAAPPAKAESVLKRIAHFELTPRKVPRKDLMHFSRQLAVFMRAGIPVVDAIDVIRAETSNKLFMQILTDMSEALQTGATFADAAAAHERTFPPYYVGVLRSAEMTGNLDSALEKLADYIERDLEARRKVVSALTYPAIIAVMAVVVVVVLVAFVLPRFKKFFSDLNAKLPLPTRILLDVTDFCSTYWYLFAGLAVGFLLALLWLTQNARGRRVRDRVLLRTPVLGDLLRHAALERFCRVFQSLISAGVTIPDAISVTADVTTNTVYRDGILEAREAMLRGEGLAGPLAATGLFPPAARQMFLVGERTGTLDSQLQTAATYYERELDYKIARFTGYFEPAVIIGMGGVVGFVAIALVSAMYGIYHQVHV